MMDVELPISKPLASVHEAEPQATSRVDATPNESRDPRRLPVPTLDSNVSIPFAPVAERLPVPPPPVSSSGSRIDYAFEDIPRFSDARSIADALRTVIMTRLLRDHQTREERVNPILMENLSLTHAEDAYPATMKTQGQLVEVVSRQRFNHSTDDPFVAAKSWLVGRFERRQVALSAKLKSLQQEYQSRHASWRRHCNILDQQAKPVEVTEVAPAPGRTTRRSAALGDTVRSDLEMEQIIASLGYDEATDPNQLSTRNLATIPDMLTGESRYTFDDTNHLVENPHEYYAPCTGIHDWTEQEKERFLDAYAKNPKQFGLIADQLPNKTASQCVDYYYLHKKRLIDFRRVVSQFAPKRGRRRAGRQKGNGLLSDIRQHDAEVHRGSDDSGLYIARPARGRPRAMPESRKPSARRSAYGIDYTETATPTPEPESEGRPKRRRVSAISRNVYFQEDGDEDTDGEPKKKKRGRKPKAAVADDSPVPTPPAMDLQSNFIQSTMQWSLEDKALFLTLVKQHGPNFKRIAIAMPDKTTAQVSDYYHSLDVGTMLADALRKGVDEGRLLPGHSTPMGAGASSAHSPSVSVSAVPETTAPVRSAPFGVLC
ncbi:hypothetical protein C8F01DRAFT_780645 [Mycena amicta]|nr:hypothetical protein C8F01DRAFT_780645 [Mycena amicta]